MGGELQDVWGNLRLPVQQTAASDGETGHTIPRVYTFKEESGHRTVEACYPLQNWLLKPFADTGRLTEEHVTYNKKICRARVVVETLLVDWRKVALPHEMEWLWCETCEINGADMLCSA